MKKKVVVIKNPKTKIRVYQDYMIIKTPISTEILAYRYIGELYINKTINIRPSELVRFATMFDTYLIDHNGYILASIRIEDEIL